VLEGDPDGALTVAAKLRDLEWDPPGNAYSAACALALCIPAVTLDTRASQDKRLELARFYADQAMAFLRDAVAKGFKDLERMKKDPDLNPLRGREDFQTLLHGLEGTTSS
jgi:hypothetical protein